MKKTLVFLVAIVFGTIFSVAAQGEELQTKSKPCEYTGTVKQKLEKPDRILLQIQEGLKEFNFIHASKKGCISWIEITNGDNIIVSCKEKKDGMEATCVQKIKSGTTLQGGTIQGGTMR
jgi:hypothetical protein